jgi:hypothetical protein
LVNVQELAASGITVLKVLEQDKMPITMAAWAPDDDDNWFLEIYTPLADRGPSRAYKRLQSALRGFEKTVPLSKIRVKKADSPEVRAMRGGIHVALGSSVDLQRSTINGRFFDHIVLLKTP